MIKKLMHLVSKNKQRLNTINFLNQKVLVWFLVTFAVVGGLIALIATHAASPSAYIDASKGSIVGNASVLADSSAASGRVVKFGGHPPSPTWSDEFNGTSLSYATDTGGGTWRTKGYESGSLSSGYSDYAGSSWDANQAQIEQYGLATVANSVLTLKTMRNPGITGVSNNWIGPYLVSNHLKSLTWRYGYFEWRMSLPNPARGMFPALWLFNNVPNRTDGYESAELDMLEVFGNSNGQPWYSAVHYLPLNMNGSAGGIVSTNSNDTTAWHRYAINWTPTDITFYKDGVVVGTITGGGATWYQHANLGIRIDYVMDPNWAAGTSQYSTPTDPVVGTTPSMLVDYVRYYNSMPSNLPAGSNDPSL